MAPSLSRSFSDKQHGLITSRTVFTAGASDPEIAAPVVAMSGGSSRSSSAGSLSSLAALAIVVDPSSANSTPVTTSIATVPSDPPAVYRGSLWDATCTMDFDTGSMDPSPPSANGSHTPLDMNLTGDNATELDMSMFTNHTAGEDDQVEVPSAGATASQLPQVPPQPSVEAVAPAPTTGTTSTDDMFRTETGLDDDDEDEDDGSDEDSAGAATKRFRRSEDVPGGFTFVDAGATRRKIRIEFIPDRSRRHITFSKRKAGIMKKAYELSILTGTQVLLLVVSETGLVYTFSTRKLSPIINSADGKKLIQACLKSEDGMGPDGNPLDPAVVATKKGTGLAIRPHKLSAAATAALEVSASALDSALSTNAEGSGSGSASSSSARPMEHPEMSGLGLGNPADRPKKRMPSRRKASSANMAAAHSNGDIPPVPPIPDIHAQAHQHSMMMQQGAMPGAYAYPSDYGQGHHPQQYANPAFGYGSNGYEYYNAQMNGQYLMPPNTHMPQSQQQQQQQQQHHHPHLSSPGGSSSHPNGNGAGMQSGGADGSNGVHGSSGGPQTMTAQQFHHMSHQQERHNRDIMLAMGHAA